MDNIAFRPFYLKKQRQGTEVRKNVNYPPFSVAMSVYEKDKAEWFDIALNSIINQTVRPDEIVLVIDGPVPKAIEDVIEKYSEICKWGGELKIIWLPENKGLGNALKTAVSECTNEIVARMDSDDISVFNRFEQQLKIFIMHPEIKIVGGDIQEFINSLDNKAGKRRVPVNDYDIKKYMKSRCPFNHVTVMYKKADVIRAGGYKDLFWDEDYYLWIRMAQKKCLMANTGTILVNVRVGEDMYMRRGGVRYFKSEKYLQEYMLRHGMVNYLEYVINLLKRVIVQLLLPNKLRGWIFQKFARD